MLPMSSLLRSFVCMFVVAYGVRCPAQDPEVPLVVVVEGRVVDVRGVGVPAAKVWVTTRLATDTVLARTIADGDGCFRIGKVPKQDDLTVRATSDGLCTGVDSVRSGRAVTVTLQSVATVRGVLRDKAGKPVANATVCAHTNIRALYEVRASTGTDEAGRFELAGVPLAPAQLSAWVPGEGIASARVDVAKDMAVDLQPTDRPTTRLVVQIEGLPAAALADVSLLLMPGGNGNLRELPPPFDRPRLQTAELVIEPAPDVDYQVLPQATKWAFTPSQRIARSNGGPHVLKFTAAARDDSTIACPIVVAGPDGKPVADARLAMRGPTGGRESTGTSDADGQLTIASTRSIGSQAVVYSLDDRWVTDQGSAKRPNDRMQDLHRFTVDPSKRLEVRLVAASSVSGRLVGRDGQPAALVPVTLELGVDVPANQPASWSQVIPLSTDRDGNFRFPRLHHIEGSVRVLCGSILGEWASEPFDLSKPGTVVQLGEAKLSAPAILEGVVRDPQKMPVGGSPLGVLGWDPVRSAPTGAYFEILTDAQGRYRLLGAPVGHVRLRMLRMEGERQTADDGPLLEIEAGKTHTVDLERPAAK